MSYFHISRLKTHIWFMLGISLLIGGLTACKSDPQPATTPSQSQTTSKTTNKTTATIKPTVENKVGHQQVNEFKSFVDQYEKIRILLAADQLTQSAQSALTLSKNLQNFLNEAKNKQHSLKSIIQDMMQAGTHMHQSKTADEQRKFFGDMSKAFLHIMQTYPQLKEGWHVFMCPMAQGYAKWAQIPPVMANPYMGKRMLKCGSASNWTP